MLREGFRPLELSIPRVCTERPVFQKNPKNVTHKRLREHQPKDLKITLSTSLNQRFHLSRVFRSQDYCGLSYLNVSEGIMAMSTFGRRTRF
jgi:hypothetical protein